MQNNFELPNQTFSSSIREIPYNYTSFSDREIVIKILGIHAWEILNKLREERVTGRSARMLFEVLGDIWVVNRNPFIEDDLLQNPKRHQDLYDALQHRLQQIISRNQQVTDEQSENKSLVNELITQAQAAVQRFDENIKQARLLRKKVRKRLKQETSANNIDFSGLARVSHVTDASDWRGEVSFVVIHPDHESEVRKIVAACIELGLAMIPRGGGTGYTGGAVPLKANTVIINTEKLDQLVYCEINNKPMVKAGAGVVTKRVAELADTQGLVFAVDPTSQDASCIGGNIAMNAGGKKAVMWGTTLDNLFSWKMVTAQATCIEVERIDHNFAKIHDVAEAKFKIKHLENDNNTLIKEEILSIPSEQLRKPGLGKDVTNKFLGGLPGIQKEGCDGIITSAVLILHKMPTHMRTVCFEYFSKDSRLSVPAIVETKEYIEKQAGVFLTGLEHLDERYIKAVNYSSKSARSEIPKMLLFADLASEDEGLLATTASALVHLANKRNGEGFIAVSKEARQFFWSDRAKTAAIAAHTNAFKLNEDVVIPLDKLGDYTLGIEKINIIQSIENKIEIINEVSNFIQSLADKIADEFLESEENLGFLQEKQALAAEIFLRTKTLWQAYLNNLDVLIKDICVDDLALNEFRNDELNDKSLFELLQTGLIQISYRSSIEQPIKQLFKGFSLRESEDTIVNILNQMHEKIRKRRLFVATHMHAGDGNVHTNIPVHSNDYIMLHKADKIVEQVMELATNLGGVISGEHGIGLTKMQFLEPSIIKEFASYKQKVDPDNHFNPGKLAEGSGLNNAYTPSLRLLQQEALIMEASEFGELNDSIKDCLRCGKCKPVCNTHIPRANLLYSPRNKILATGMIIEAFLYEEQTRRGISVCHFDAMNDIADHCTVCHKCLSPCPVNIDFGDVSILLRKLLKDKKARKSSPMTLAAMAFLNITDPVTLKIIRKLLIEWAYKSQRFTLKMLKNVKPLANLLPTNELPKPTQGKMQMTTQVVHFLKKPMPKSIPSRMMRDLLNIEDNKIIPIIRDPNKTTPQTEAVFYFPGCGSERLFSQIGSATMAMLYDLGVQTVVPPGYLCCGYPQTAGGDKAKGKQISTDNQVLFHRVANTLNYMDIKTIIVSCGTCMDQLLKYQFSQIFPGSRLLDIHEYLKEKGVQLDPNNGKKYIYHDPCHTPMKKHNPLSVAKKLLNTEVVLSDRCCGESGTLAVSRPDIATQLRFRKLEEINKNIETIETAAPDNVKLMTSCPACQQGLERYQQDTQLEVDYIVVELCKELYGENWHHDFVKKVNAGGIERVLL